MNTYTRFKDFMPLMIIFILICLATLARQMRSGLDTMYAMSDFMGFFFIIFASFKLFNWQGFVDAYHMYDILAQKSKLYAYAYPLIELSLGIAYLIRWHLFAINIVTLILMIISSIGVARELRNHRKITCACLGTVFKIPMTYVTLAEDLLMAGMAALMLLFTHR